MRDSATNDGSKYQDQTGVLKLAEFCKVCTRPHRSADPFRLGWGDRSSTRRA